MWLLAIFGVVGIVVGILGLLGVIGLSVPISVVIIVVGFVLIFIGGGVSGRLNRQ